MAPESLFPYNSTRGISFPPPSLQLKPTPTWNHLCIRYNLFLVIHGTSLVLQVSWAGNHGVTVSCLTCVIPGHRSVHTQTTAVTSSCCLCLWPLFSPFSILPPKWSSTPQGVGAVKGSWRVHVVPCLKNLPPQAAENTHTHKVATKEMEGIPGENREKWLGQEWRRV